MLGWLASTLLGMAHSRFIGGKQAPGKERGDVLLRRKVGNPLRKGWTPASTDAFVNDRDAIDQSESSSSGPGPKIASSSEGCSSLGPSMMILLATISVLLLSLPLLSFHLRVCILPST